MPPKRKIAAVEEDDEVVAIKKPKVKTVLERKKKEWQKWKLNTEEDGVNGDWYNYFYGSEEALKAVRELIFSWVQYTGVVRRKNRYTATLHIGDEVKIRYLSKGPEGSCTLTYDNKGLLSQGWCNMVNKHALIKLREALQIPELVNDQQLVYSLILALPWKRGEMLYHFEQIEYNDTGCFLDASDDEDN
jgi:hypothetical protein